MWRELSYNSPLDLLLCIMEVAFVAQCCRKYAIGGKMLQFPYAEWKKGASIFPCFRSVLKHMVSQTFRDAKVWLLPPPQTVLEKSICLVIQVVEKMARKLM